MLDVLCNVADLLRATSWLSIRRRHPALFRPRPCFHRMAGHRIRLVAVLCRMLQKQVNAR